MQAEKAMMLARAQSDAARVLWDYEGTLIATDLAIQQEQKMRSLFQQAIDMTRNAYRVDPLSPAGRVAKPKDSQGDWATGIKAEWNVEFVHDTKNYVHLVGGQGENHFLGGQINLRDAGGRTYPDGHVVIFRQVFEDVVAKGNPGPLAWLLYHESRHFEDLVGRGWGSLEQNEVRGYTESFKKADAFELSGGDILKLKGIRDGYLRAIRDGKQSSLFPTPEEEKWNESEYTRIQDELAKFQQGYDSLKNQVAAEKEARRQRELTDSVRVSDSDACADLARRSCGQPGSVTQKELDFIWSHMSDGLHVSFEVEARSRGLGACETKVYVHLMTSRMSHAARVDGASLSDLARRTKSETAWNDMWEAAFTAQNLAATYCADPKSVQSFSGSIRRIGHYLDTYSDFYGYVREIAAARTDAIGNCAMRVIDEALPRGLPGPGRQWSFNPEDFRRSAARHSPGPIGPGSGQELPPVRLPGNGGMEPGVPDCLRWDGGRCIRW
ncbi:MAG: hypothetical protein A2X36_12945 [Elusimicrobia bacterium GWA2_69_24]|nr:MAG: hypothetical protein A2X36_12945 [Elusimicrobia bacterium GWA2_69_24]